MIKNQLLVEISNLLGAEINKDSHWTYNSAHSTRLHCIKILQNKIITLVTFLLVHANIEIFIDIYKPATVKLREDPFVQSLPVVILKGRFVGNVFITCQYEVECDSYYRNLSFIY